MDSEGHESLPPQGKKVALIGRVTEILPNYHKDLIVDGDNIGISQWNEMLRLTQDDSRERGIVVSQESNGHFMASTIFKGTGENGTHHAQIETPVFPHGLRNALSRLRRVVHVHTHPMPDELKHLQTSVISDLDIASFYDSQDAAMVMIDRGGAHLLVNIDRYKTTRPPSNLAGRLVDEAAKKEEKVFDVMRKLALELPQYGLAYYYSQSLTPDHTNSISFKKPE